VALESAEQGLLWEIAVERAENARAVEEMQEAADAAEGKLVMLKCALAWAGMEQEAGSPGVQAVRAVVK
jgi:hypothetical protein